MIIGGKGNENELMVFIPAIKSNMSDWQIISVKIPSRGKVHYDLTMKQLFDLYEKSDGIILPVNDVKILLIARLGNIDDYTNLKAEIESKLPMKDARVVAKKMSKVGLKEIQLNLSDKTGDGSKSRHEEREERDKNIFLIAEDDVFVRETLSKLLKAHGDVIETEDGSNVKELYLEHNPDIVLLDIHMPHKDGLTLVNELIEADLDAYIIVASADSVKDNVVEAIARGAFGFLAKPIKKEKLLEYIAQCVTCSRVT